MARGSTLLEQLQQRRRRLRMSYRAVAKRSGVSEPTVKRILSGGADKAAFANVRAVAEALGVGMRLEPLDEADFSAKEARAKAERLVRLVQGSAALEGQAVERKARQSMVERTVQELLTQRSRRNLWG